MIELCHEFSDDDDFGIIVLNENGEEYTNQTGGIFCNHPSAKGFLIRGKDLHETIYNQTESVDISKVKEWPLGFLPDGKSIEEAWISGKLGSSDAILVYCNSD